ncbi:hypothetical protein IFM89_015469 [Coptis chinensis]|uniref:Protein kinase domain-containing protein n=1 Tax=Coptis chinensis TaxID=261450 RepID=A0A835I821_9MAGN|nr:hypothetical protein IFM89_015469 [Coptis chinensis]
MWWWSRFLRSPKKNKLEPKNEEEAFLLANGALLLQKLVALCDAKSTPLRIFSAKDLNLATNNYHGHHHVLRHTYNYTLYKGILDHRLVLIKKFQDHDYLFTEQDQGSHLDFRISPNGALSDHIYSSPKHLPPLPLETRLRIAMDIADAGTYLHLANSKTIIHRHISSDNIFLDQHFGAKLSDFGLSVSIPYGERHVDAQVMGTFEFTAPECIARGRYTEKSDVFGFGAVFFEIITGNGAHNILELTVSGVMDHPVPSTQMLTELYLETNIFQLENKEQLRACSELALRCVKQDPEERPTMKKVAQELRQITLLQQREDCKDF